MTHTIYVNDNPATAKCPPVEHWKKALNGENELNGSPVIYDDNAKEDSVIVRDKDGIIVLSYYDDLADDMHIISVEIQELKGGSITWEEFVKRNS